MWSWGIIFSKSLLLRKIRKESETFWKVFRRGQNLSEIRTACETLRFTPLVPVLTAGGDLLLPASGRVHSQGSLALKTSTVTVATIHRTCKRPAAGQWTE